MAQYPGLRRKTVARDAGHSGRPAIAARPANDNYKPPRPANDNIPSRSARLAPSMTQFRKATALAGLNQASRLLAAGMAVYELGKNWYDFAQGNVEASTEQFVQDANWEQTRGPCGASGSPTFYEWLGTGLAPGACLVGQAVSPASRKTDYNDYPAANADGVNVWVYTSCPPAPGSDYGTCNALNPGFPRFALEASFRKIVTGLPNLPAPHYETVQVNHVPFLPLGDPITDPSNLPIEQPVPLARPVPVKKMHEYRKAHEKVLREQAPFRAGLRYIVQPVRVIPGTMPLGRIDLLPEQNIQVYPRQAPVGASGGHKFTKPPKGVKERKFKLNMPAGISFAVNLVTESLDVLDALYYAIPKKFRRGETTPQAKARAVYKNFLKLDAEKALENLLVNELGDRLYGGVSRKLKSSYKANFDNYGLRGGYQLGPAL